MQCHFVCTPSSCTVLLPVGPRDARPCRWILYRAAGLFDKRVNACMPDASWLSTPGECPPHVLLLWGVEVVVIHVCMCGSTLLHMPSACTVRCTAPAVCSAVCCGEIPTTRGIAQLVVALALLSDSSHMHQSLKAMGRVVCVPPGALQLPTWLCCDHLLVTRCCLQLGAKCPA
jgi:hypothetical protein